MSKSTDPSKGQLNIQRYYQSDFSGGLRLNIDSTKIEDNQYLYLKNMRNRFGRLSPVKLPKLAKAGLSNNGSIQGLYGAGNFLLCVENGIIYFRDFLDDTGYFRKLSSEFTLDPRVETVYMELVPSSYNNYLRQSTSTDPSVDINLSNNIGSPSPQSALIMDGVNQPLVISPDGQVRKAQTFAQWTLGGNREYIPIGVMPMYSGGILYVVSPDFKEIYHSVTGRPMDFVQAIDTDGNKIQDGAFPVEASRLSHKIDFENILAIGKINTPDASFYACTINNSYLVSPNRTQTFFGEPGFDNIFLFSTGALNPFSVVDILGDTSFIDIRGIRKFNAVQQLKFEGKNDPFSNNISLYFKDILQKATATASFDNYNLFSVNSIYGPIVAIYDTLSQSWVGIDMYPGVGQIKQFAQIKIKGIHKLFFFDDKNNVYEAFADSTTAPWQYYREFSTNNPEMEQQLLRVNCIFQNVLESGEVSVSSFSDRRLDNTVTQNITKNTIGTTTIVPPFGDNTVDRIAGRTFKFPEEGQGFKTGVLVEGNIDLELIHLEAIAEGIETEVSIDQQAEIYANAG